MATKIINNECWISINLNELVKRRAEILHLCLDEVNIDAVANDCRNMLSYDSIFGQIDELLMESVEFGEISETFPPEMKYETIEGNGWELKVPTGVSRGL